MANGFSYEVGKTQKKIIRVRKGGGGSLSQMQGKLPNILGKCVISKKKRVEGKKERISHNERK